MLAVMVGLLAIVQWIFVLPEGLRSLLTVLLGIGITLEAMTASFALLARALKHAPPSYFRLVSVLCARSRETNSQRIARRLSLHSHRHLRVFNRYVCEDRETARVESEITAEYFLTNLFDYSPALKTELESFASVASADEAILFHKVALSSNGRTKVLKYFIAMDASSFATRLHSI
ncbi:MAG: hypothetical protein MZU97_16290 [Bacillus subtilis]|nr:hypothetical protein [Bacillus subtilis]